MAIVAQLPAVGSQTIRAVMVTQYDGFTTRGDDFPSAPAKLAALGTLPVRINADSLRGNGSGNYDVSSRGWIGGSSTGDPAAFDFTRYNSLLKTGWDAEGVAPHCSPIWPPEDMWTWNDVPFTVAAVAGGSFGAGTYRVRVCGYESTANAETPFSTLQTVVVTANQKLQIVVTNDVSSSHYRVYLSPANGGAGTETLQSTTAKSAGTTTTIPDITSYVAGTLQMMTSSPGLVADQTWVAYGNYLANLVAYYNNVSDPNATPANSQPVGWTGSVKPTPWPPPAGLGFAKQNGGAGVLTWEIWNEPNFGTENYRYVPVLDLPDAPTLAKAAGGTLTAGTYTYQLASMDHLGNETNLGPVGTITLSAGDITGNLKSVTLTWTLKTSIGAKPWGTRVYGRSGTVLLMQSIGKNPTQTWTDDGTVTPAGSPQTLNQTGGAGTRPVSPRMLTDLWNVCVPKMRAASVATIKVGGPCTAGSMDGNGWNSTNPDTGVIEPTNYLERLAANVGAGGVPDMYTGHLYASDILGAPDTDEVILNTGLNAGGWMLGQGQIAADTLPTRDCWVTELNVSSAGGRPGAGTAFGVALLGRTFLKFAGILHSGAAQFTNLYQFMYAHQAGLTLLDGSGNRTMPYWLLKLLAAKFPSGSKVLTVTGTPAGVDVLSVALAPSFVNVVTLVVNSEVAVPATDVGGAGVGKTVTVDLTGATVTARRLTIIDSGTTETGPVTTTPGASPVSVTFAGYGLAIVEFDTSATTTAASVELFAPIRTMTVGGSEARW